MKLFGHLSVYGLLIAAAVALGVFYCTRQEKRLGLPKDTGVDFALWVMPAALIGARVGEVFSAATPGGVRRLRIVDIAM